MVTPLLALTGYTLYANLERAKLEAYEEVHDRAEYAARVVEDALDISERLVMLVAAREERLDTTVDKDFLAGLAEIDSAHGVLWVVNSNGEVRSSSSSPVLPATNTPINVADAKWFAEAKAKNGLVLTSAFVSRTTDRPVVVLTYPVHPRPGRDGGIVLVSLDLEKLGADMRADWAAKRGVVALVSDDDKILVREPGTRENMGKPAAKAVVRLREKKQSEVIIDRGTDGLQRVYAGTGITRYGLRVAASIPEDDVLAAPYAEIRRGGVTAAVALLLAGLLGWLGTRSLSRPMRSLSLTAQAHARNETDKRADESLPGEFGDLAVEINALLDARQASEADAAAARLHEQRVARFYECLLRTNQAISRITDQPALLRRICEICVDTGQASLAWVGLIRDDLLEPVAWGGPARSYTEGRELHLSTGLGTVGAAIRAGETMNSDDYMNDPRTLLSRERASSLGIRSACSVPLKQAGAVVGTLNLYASETHFFDRESLRLLEDLAGDVSAALDAIGLAEEHSRTVAELKQSEASLAGVVASSLDAIATVDSEGRIRLWNSAAERMFGAATDEVIGHSYFGFIPPERANDHLERLSRYMSDLTQGGGRVDRPLLKLIRRDGTRFEALASISRYHAADGPMLVVTLRGAAEEQDAQRARDAAAASEASSEAKSHFMSRMSHELRTPLNVVLGFSQLLQEGAKKRLDERERKQLDLIFLAGAQLRALVDDVLDYSVIESGRLQVTLQDFELTEMLDGVIRMSEASARAAQVRIEPSYERLRPFHLRTDPVRLRQVMLNLLSNAVKYNRPGGSVVMSAEAPHGLVRMEVRDTGLGMTEEQVAGLYQPFNRLGREKTEIPGSGIGMVLVRQLVELMGGSLSVESKADHGTVVRVELPRPKIAAPLMDGDPSALELPPLEDGQERAPEGTILYIEDNPINVMLVEEMLREWEGVRVVVAGDGESGIQQAVGLKPDLVLLDMHLPDMTGLEVLATLNAMKVMQELAVVGLSASAMDEEVAAAQAAGTRDYWKKPVDVAAFRRNVRRILDEARKRPRNEQ